MTVGARLKWALIGTVLAMSSVRRHVRRARTVRGHGDHNRDPSLEAVAAEVADKAVA